MPRSKRVKLLGYFSNWGSLVEVPFAPLPKIATSHDILRRLESIEFIPKRSWWYKQSQQLMLYSYAVNWNVEDVCRLFFMLEKMNIKFPDLIIRNINLLSTNDLTVQQSIVVINSLVYNKINLENLSLKLVGNLEKKGYLWKFTDLCCICYNIYMLNLTTSLFDKLRKLSTRPEFTTDNLQKQLDICSKLLIRLDLSNVDQQINLKKCSVESLISLANHGYVNIEVLLQRLPQFSCSNLAKLSLSLHKLPPAHASSISTHILYCITTQSHKLTIVDSIKLLKGLYRIGVTSELLDSIICERIYHWQLFEPPSIDNYEYWKYLHQSKKYPNLPHFEQFFTIE
ncbi:hypothetical protein BMR1_01G02645 [Babesia microti strain RI]|uniref:Uncharacterized protein n=1 Tax=Babesia microti (strain RI) TaxID=1133968 RepID=I7J8S4_BABMR|nr:hypothetical protein BMR1_01G02645 [Babesia microti strain RI]CCF72984.1 hypothetical protein BMR1_01G02645 [Babesia microti strain RI]|eukprot:XP_012647593.1 hypothetical protein BMR1_01G02645 [Babesia microti strain RI]